MILWTIQSKAAYESLCEKGTLIAGKEHTIFESHYEPAYRWMIEQMNRRIGPAPKGAMYPIWAWYQWEGERKRPDMRSHGITGEPGNTIVLLTIDVPDDEVLLSDFDDWNLVMGGFPITEDDREYSHTETEKTWDHIFDYENPVAGCKLGLSTQATLWQI